MNERKSQSKIVLDVSVCFTTQTLCDVRPHTEVISKELNSSERIQVNFPAQAVPEKLCSSRLEASLSGSCLLTGEPAVCPGCDELES